VWNKEIASPFEWLGTKETDAPQTVKAILEGKTHRHCGFSYRIEKEIPNLMWTLKNSERYFSVFLADMFSARKQAT